MNMNVKRSLMVAAMIVIALMSAWAQDDEPIAPDKIEPGNYREILNGLALSRRETVQLSLGMTRLFKVMARGPSLREVVAPTEWTVTEVGGVSIDKNGLLTVAATVKGGTGLKVTAKVLIKEPWEDKGDVYTIEQAVIVFDPEENPLVGEWQQISMTLCRGGKIAVGGQNGVGSLEFRADGSYSAAVAPNTWRRDYWGKYTFDTKKKTLKMTVDGGEGGLMYLKTKGQFDIRNGTLTLTGMQLYPDRPWWKPCKAHFTNKSK